MISWLQPSPGDVVWCHLPYLPATAPGPKPRPAMVVGVRKFEGGAAGGLRDHAAHNDFACR
jgi:hypothetical protein